MSVRVKDWIGEVKYLGPSKAIIIDNKDPSHKGRLRILSPVFGESPWIHFLNVEDGFFGIPDVGSVVLVEADGGDPNYVIIRGVYNDGDALDPDTPTIFRRDVPTNRGWVSPGDLDSLGKPVSSNSGHSLELDDGIALNSDGTITQTAESRGIRLNTSGGHSLKILEEGTDGQQQNRIQASTTGGHSLSLIDEAGNTSSQQRVEMVTTSGQSFQMIDDEDSAKQQIVIKDADERTIEVLKETDRIRIRNSSGTIYIDINFANDTIEIDAENVKLGTSAAQSIVRGDAFKTFFEGHTHPAPGGPTGPPFQTMTSGVEISDKHKVE